MTVFGAYSRYYDLLYRDKNYEAETGFIAGLIDRYHNTTKKVLELGCGTGKHAELLVNHGFELHGVDRSEEMLSSANARCGELSAELQKNLQFSLGDVRNCKINGLFDAVISLFHVVSYQTTTDDLIAMFKNAHAHLKPGGIFIFDYWYGPAVLTDRPQSRVKEMESDAIKVTRYAEPVLHAKESIVDVNYRIIIQDKHSNMTEELRETHHMHYLFESEIALLANIAGFKIVDACEWMSGKKTGFDTWSVCHILRK